MTSLSLSSTKTKDEVIVAIMTYISRKTFFHIIGIKCSHVVSYKLNLLFNNVNESQAMRLEKYLISLEPCSFERIEEYLACMKEIQLKLGECGKDFPKKDG